MRDGRTIRWIAGESRRCAAINVARANGATSERLHTGPHRWIESLAVDAPEPQPLVLKWFAPRTPPIRQQRDRLLGRTADAREWRALTALHAAGLPVPEPLAWGRTMQGDRVVVMTHVGEAPLLERLADLPGEERDPLFARLAETIRALHEAGFVHGDLHAGNLRVSAADDIHLLDLGRVRRTTRDAARSQDPARLLHSLAPVLPAASLDTLATHFAPYSRLDDARRRFLADHARGRARRFHRIGEDWQRLTAPGGWTGVGVRHLDASLLTEALLDAEATHREAPRREGRVTIEGLERGDARWIRKHVDAGSLRRAIADRGRGSTAARAFRLGERDRLVSERAAPALAFLERRAPGHVPESLLLLESVGDVDLDAWRPASPEETKHLSTALIDWLVGQHAQGLGHRDAKGGNVRVRLQGQGAPRFWWVDLEDLTGPAPLDEAARLRALVQLNASIADDVMDLDTRRDALARYHARLPFSRDLADVAKEIHARSVARHHRYRGAMP